MKKNAGGTWRRIRGLGIVRLPRVALLVIALAVPAGILLAIPGPASAQGANSDLMALGTLANPAPVAPGGSISGTVTAAGRGPAKGRRLRGICVGAITPQGAPVFS